MTGTDTNVTGTDTPVTGTHTSDRDRHTSDGDTRTTYRDRHTVTGIDTPLTGPDTPVTPVTGTHTSDKDRHTTDRNRQCTTRLSDRLCVSCSVACVVGYAYITRVDVTPSCPLFLQPTVERVRPMAYLSPQSSSLETTFFSVSTRPAGEDNRRK